MRCIALFAILFSIPICASAQTTWYVPGDFTTIQAAISDPSVLDGDTIVVRPGTYAENIDFLGKAITLTSESGPDVTVIDGKRKDSVVYFITGEGPDSVVEGFTLTNGDRWAGGGIFCKNSSPTVRHNIIIGNTANVGAGICCFDSSPFIVNNLISENASGSYAGAIHCQNGTVVITGNTITYNSSDPYSGACGGVDCDFCSATITHNIIAWNLGAGLWITYSTATVAHNLITGNTTNELFSGGGVVCGGTSTVDISNCTICANRTDNYGGGIFQQGFSSLTITNSILWENAAALGGHEIYVWGNSVPAPTLTIGYSDIKTGADDIYVHPSATLNWNAGMIEQDPLFADDANSDFHLTYPSPCKDAGDNAAVSGTLDFEYDPRIAYGTVDMGADEFHPHLYYTGDASPSGSIQAKFVGFPGTLINGVIIGVNLFDPPLPCDYGLWYMDQPYQIITGLGAIPSDGIAIFPGTLPAVPPTPYTIYLQGVIDMELTNLCPVQIK